MPYQRTLMGYRRNSGSACAWRHRHKAVRLDAASRALSTIEQAVTTLKSNVLAGCAKVRVPFLTCVGWHRSTIERCGYRAIASLKSGIRPIPLLQFAL